MTQPVPNSAQGDRAGDTTTYGPELEVVWFQWCLSLPGPAVFLRDMKNHCHLLHTGEARRVHENGENPQPLRPGPVPYLLEEASKDRGVCSGVTPKRLKLILQEKQQLLWTRDHCVPGTVPGARVSSS